MFILLFKACSVKLKHESTCSSTCTPTPQIFTPQHPQHPCPHHNAIRTISTHTQPHTTPPPPPPPPPSSKTSFQTPTRFSTPTPAHPATPTPRKKITRGEGLERGLTWDEGKVGNEGRKL